MRRIGILFLTTAILFVFCTNNLCMAHENDYSPTSSLNQGWQQGIEGGIEVAHAIFGDKPELVGMTAEIGDDSSEIRAIMHDISMWISMILLHTRLRTVKAMLWLLNTMMKDVQV